jgi:hypothetical protein
MFCAPGLIFGGTEGVGASGPVCIYCSTGLIFGGTGGLGSRFLIWCARTCFRRYRGRLVPFSCFANPDSLSAVSRASNLIFMFSAPGHVFGGIEGVESLFHVLRSETRFRRYRGRRDPFSCFALPESFSMVPSASGAVLMFCTPGLVFGGTECIRSRFRVLRARTHFLRYRWRRVPFSSFCALGLVFGGTEGVGSLFHILRSRTRFRR